ncbi:MAG: DUF1573 domain-containing protein [Planctomycetota bacterium]|nr:MAG: DUF1573 domain-containing protein [Planctomycetota bacterium]
MISICFAILTQIATLQQADYRSKQPNDNIRCGIYCLTTATSALGNRDVTIEKIESILSEPSEKGYSLLQLGNAARELGFETITVRSSFENLLYRRRSIGEKFACVASFGQDHFVLVYGIEGNSVLIADPPRTYKLDRPVFEKEWAGNCLLIGTAPLASEENITSMIASRIMFKRIGLAFASILLVAVAILFFVRRRAAFLKFTSLSCILLCLLSGCDKPGFKTAELDLNANQEPKVVPSGQIEISPSRHSLGVVRGGQGRMIPIVSEIRNTSDEVLKINRVVVSCGCTQASVDQSLIQPGGVAKLTANVKVGDVQDARSAHVQVESSDPAHPVSEIAIDWVADLPLKTSPTSFVRQNLSIGGSNEFEIDVVLKFISLCKDCTIRSSSPSGSLILGWSPKANLKSSGSHENSDDGAEVTIGVLKAKIIPKDFDLHHREEVQIELVCGDRTLATTNLPFTWTFHQIFSVTPTRLFFGSLKNGQEATKSFVIRSMDDKNLNIRSVRALDPGLSFQTRVERLSEKESQIHLTLKVPAKQGPWADEILIETESDEQSIIRLPYSFLVR